MGYAVSQKGLKLIVAKIGTKLQRRCYATFLHKPLNSRKKKLKSLRITNLYLPINHISCQTSLSIENLHFQLLCNSGAQVSPPYSLPFYSFTKNSIPVTANHIHCMRYSHQVRLLTTFPNCVLVIR